MGRRPASPARRSKGKEFLTYFVVLLVVLGFATRHLAKGRLFYQNFWGGAVFVPFVLLVALVVVIIIVLNWNRK